MIKLGLKVYLKGILPLENEIQTLNSHLTKINNVLNTNSKLLSIKSVRNGGSFAKRTMLKRRLEADVVYIINKQNWDKHYLINISKMLDGVLKYTSNVKKVAIEIVLK